MISNMLIAESMNTLDVDTLFQNDIEDSMMKINEIIAILELYKYVVHHFVWCVCVCVGDWLFSFFFF